ncbi:MAG: hypothetical protein LBG58_10300 [Planctomycetaceae bacterium]|nr:hypothetical protein [Planctomycetaceae bacterium]
MFSRDSPNDSDKQFGQLFHIQSRNRKVVKKHSGIRTISSGSVSAAEKSKSKSSRQWDVAVTVLLLSPKPKTQV